MQYIHSGHPTIWHNLLSLKQASRPYQSRIHSSNSQTQRMCCELCYICTHYLPTRNHSPTEAVVNTSTWPELNTKVSQFRNWFEINPRLFTSKRYMPGKWHDYGNIFSPKAAVNTSTCQPGVLCIELWFINQEFVSINLYFECLHQFYCILCFMDAQDNSLYNATDIRVCSPVHAAAVD